jgi:hypothetical protein
MKAPRKTSRQNTALLRDDVQAWKSVGDIPGFPFDKFDEMQAAVSARSFNIGVDPLAAAEWSDRFGKGFKRVIVAALSVLLIVAAVASVIAAFVTEDYWLLAAPVVQALAFYFSHPASQFQKWATVGGALTLPLFINFLLNHQTSAATLVAYAGLTFACVRAAAFITSSTFRKALLSDEKLFLTAYRDRACTLRNSRTKKVHAI